MKGLIRYEYWSPEHNPNSTLTPGVLSSVTPAKNHTNDGRDGRNSNQSCCGTALGFISLLVLGETLRCSIASRTSSNFDGGPRVDDGAPYKATGYFEL